ncbi:MAG: GNAT family N-acetyltransferase [Anaerolineales bacterium]|jgi:putative acetyltransferase
MPSNTSQILIRPFHPDDQSAAKALILAGLAEHWGWLDPTCNPDLDDITTSYADALFLVAYLAGQVVGTGALLRRSQTIAEIVRMSVAKPYRQRGIGRLILTHLVDMARQTGFKQVVLETTASWHEVVQFYKNNGFQVTHYQDGDIYFCLDLTRPNKPSQPGWQQEKEE